MTQNEAQTLIRKQIFEGTVWNHPSYEESIEGLAQAFHGADRAAMVAACAELLTDPDVRIRSGISTVLSHLTQDLGTEWLVTLLEGRPELYVGVEPVGARLNQPDLEKEILIAIAEAAQPGESRSINLLRKAAHEPGWGIWLLPTLARIDGEWLSGHSELIPHRMISVLPPLTPDQREKVVLSLAPWSADVVAGISSGFWSQFSPEEAKHLQKLMETP